MSHVYKPLPTCFLSFSDVCNEPSLSIFLLDIPPCGEESELKHILAFSAETDHGDTKSVICTKCWALLLDFLGHLNTDHDLPLASVSLIADLACPSFPPLPHSFIGECPTKFRSQPSAFAHVTIFKSQFPH